ncbi:MAG: four-carbon acid sugar kinase family protein [Acuticoccus sp.]
MPWLAIIADDLTGALDTAAPFAASPRGVAVASRPDALAGALAAGTDVVAVSTRSREVAPVAAREAVEAVLAALPDGIRVLKKVDSRLKGNIVAELAPFAPRRLLAAPAIPEFGRVVRGGMLCGFGIDTPIDVRGRLGPHVDAALVPDTVTQGDLARALAAAGEDTVLVGARGLSTALADAAGLGAPCPAGALAHPLAIVVGSTDPITTAQVARLGAEAAGVPIVDAPAGRVPTPGKGAPPPVTLLRIAPDAGGGEAGATVAARFAAGAVPWIKRVRALILTGGATAEAVLDALDLSVFALRGEALPGMPLIAAGAWQAVTKSGGFGEADALVRLAALSRREA